MSSTFTTFSNLVAVLPSLTPWIEESAYRFAMYNSVLPARVSVYSDMQGYNTRRVSEYIRNRRAQQLSEAVAIPDTVARRLNIAEVSPQEWGDSYPVSERRVTTDLENVLADIISFLGDSLAMRKEKVLMRTLLSGKTAANTINVSGNYTLNEPIALQQEFMKRAFTRDDTFHLIHPFQALPIKKELIDLTRPADNVTRASINRWLMGGGQGTEMVETPTLPRKITYRLVITATSGTFKLRAGELNNGAEAITANITVSTTASTMVTNIKTALDALGIGTWTVSGTALTDITVESPIYVDAEDELQIALKPDGTPDTALTGGTVVIQEKSARCAAPFYSRDAIILDLRQPFRYRFEENIKERVLQNYATEVFGAALWRKDRLFFVETNATSPLAVP